MLAHWATSKWTRTLAVPAQTCSVLGPIRGLHLTSRRPSPAHTALVTIGAATAPTIRGGSIVETFDCYAGTGSRIVATVADAVDWRILPAGTYFLKPANMSNGTATGVFSLMWEELP